MAPGALLEPDQQCPEPVEPGQGALHHPAPGGMPAPVRGWRGFPPLSDVGHLPPGADGGRGRRAAVPRIGAQVLAVVGLGNGPRTDEPVQGGHGEADVMPIGSADAHRQRDSTGVDQEAALGALCFPEPWGGGPRPPGPAARSRGRCRCAATARRSLRARRPRRAPGATGRRTPRPASTPGSICGWNWHSHTPLWAQPSIGSPSGGRRQWPRTPGGAPRGAGRPPASAGTLGSGPDAVGGSAAPLVPRVRPTRSMIGG